VSLTAKDIAEIAKLLDSSHFATLDLMVGDFRLRIRREGGWSGDDDETLGLDRAPAKAGAQGPPALAPRLRGDAESADSDPPPIGQEAGAARVGEIDVPAPLLGNFYAAPRPGEPPFVSVGDTVSEDSVIGIIEVMKLMNSVRAGVAGKASRWCGSGGRGEMTYPLRLASLGTSPVNGGGSAALQILPRLRGRCPRSGRRGPG
jgi:acetyl-CoA carboxylase biotin carboxyl carrier protein